jgi:hypothetical protein
MKVRYQLKVLGLQKQGMYITSFSMSLQNLVTDTNLMKENVAFKSLL